MNAHDYWTRRPGVTTLGTVHTIGSSGQAQGLGPFGQYFHLDGARQTGRPSIRSCSGCRRQPLTGALHALPSTAATVLGPVKWSEASAAPSFHPCLFWQPAGRDALARLGLGPGHAGTGGRARDALRLSL